MNARENVLYRRVVDPCLASAFYRDPVGYAAAVENSPLYAVVASVDSGCIVGVLPSETDKGASLPVVRCLEHGEIGEHQMHGFGRVGRCHYGMADHVDPVGEEDGTVGMCVDHLLDFVRHIGLSVSFCEICRYYIKAGLDCVDCRRGEHEDCEKYGFNCFHVHKGTEFFRIVDAICVKNFLISFPMTARSRMSRRSGLIGSWRWNIPVQVSGMHVAVRKTIWFLIFNIMSYKRYLLFLLSAACLAGCAGQIPSMDELLPPGTFNLSTVVTDSNGNQVDIAGDWAVFRDPGESEFTVFVHYDQESKSIFSVLDNEIFMIGCEAGRRTLPVYENGVVDQPRSIFLPRSTDKIIYKEGRVYQDRRDWCLLYEAPYGNPEPIVIIDSDTLSFEDLPNTRLRRIISFAAE